MIESLRIQLSEAGVDIKSEPDFDADDSDDGGDGKGGGAAADTDAGAEGADAEPYGTGQGPFHICSSLIADRCVIN